MDPHFPHLCANPFLCLAAQEGRPKSLVHLRCQSLQACRQSWEAPLQLLQVHLLAAEHSQLLAIGGAMEVEHEAHTNTPEGQIPLNFQHVSHPSTEHTPKV